MSTEWGESLKRGQDALMALDWGHLLHQVLDRVKSGMAEHEVAMFLPCARLVNRHWCRWATQAIKHVELRGGGQRFQEEFEGVVRCFSALEHIILNRKEGIDLWPLEHAYALRHLKINCEYKYVAHLELCTTLVDLQLQGNDSPQQVPLDLPVVVATLTRLEKLVLYLRWSVDGDECVAILAALPSLTELCLHGAKISDAGAKCMAAMPKLIKCTLMLKDGSLEDVEVWKDLGMMTRLVALNIIESGKCVRQASVEGAACLGKLTNLTSLELWTFTSGAGLQLLTCLTALSHICFNCYESTDEGLRSLERFSALSSLRLEYLNTPWWTPCVELKWIGALAGLVDLELRRFGRSMDISSLMTLEALTSLRIFPQHGYQITNVACLASLTALRKLQFGNGCVSGESIDCLSVLTNLTNLWLSGSLATTDSSVEKLATLTSLTELRLRNCRSITDGGVVTLSQLTSLSFLDLGDCPEITDASVKQLVSLPFLRRLNLDGCKKANMSVDQILRKWG